MSIVAVFMALAIGIVLGTTTLNDAVLRNLRSSISDLTGDKRALEDSVRQLRGQVNAGEQAAGALAPGLVAGRLTGQRVLLVSAPDAPAGLGDGLAPLLAQAGATAAGQVRLDDSLLASTDEQVLREVAAVPLPGAAGTGEPADRALGVLAAALTRRPGSPAIPDETRDRAVAAFVDADLIEVSDPLQPATAVVLLTGPAPAPLPIDEAEQELAARRVRGLLRLAERLDTGASGVVVVGVQPAAQEATVVQAVREDGGLSGEVSTVDDADTERGRLAVVLALQEQLSGESGQYGSGPNADSALPESMIASPTPAR